MESAPPEQDPPHNDQARNWEEMIAEANTPSDLGIPSVRESAAAVFAYFAFGSSVFFLFVARAWRGGASWLSYSAGACAAGVIIFACIGLAGMRRIVFGWWSSHMTGILLLVISLALIAIHQLGALFFLVVIAFPIFTLSVLGAVLTPYVRARKHRLDKVIASLMTLLFVMGIVAASKTRFNAFSAGLRLRLLLVESQLQAEADHELTHPRSYPSEYDIPDHEAFVIYPRDKDGHGVVGWKEMPAILATYGFVFDPGRRIDRGTGVHWTENAPRISLCSQIEGPWYWCRMG
jgi:hypothetical protein